MHDYLYSTRTKVMIIEACKHETTKLLTVVVMTKTMKIAAPVILTVAPTVNNNRNCSHSRRNGNNNTNNGQSRNAHGNYHNDSKHGVAIRRLTKTNNENACVWRDRRFAVNLLLM